MAATNQTLPLSAIRERLRAFAFRDLFNELGWDHLQRSMTVEAEGDDYDLQGIAHKRGFQVYHCAPGPDGAIPNRSIRRRIDREVGKGAQEHLLIFTDAANTAQVWQWSRRDPGKPFQHHEHELHAGQSGEALAQRLQRLYVSIEDEAALTIPDVVSRVRGGLGAAERVTRAFYTRFKQEHEAFRGFIEGISAATDRDWYASLMLNRLMFVYFIQKKGFLDGDQDYLRHKLAEVRANQGEGQFLSFYRHFLRKLFHGGLSQQEAERTPELDELLGSVPYPNGGLFDVHALESLYAEIDVADDAFAKLFDFFDSYRWHLDERPLRQDDVINPDVLGYIFEKYINQKQMGAYYTKEDITGYIARNTIIPALFDMARPEARIAFEPGSALWRLLQENPDRYLYPAMRKGMDLTPSAEIAAGVDDISARGGWNRPAAEAYALPTETWREHMARRQRHNEIKKKLIDGEVHQIDDLITLNLDIHQFAIDAIAECEGPETLRAFWRAISRISVLDPTCGSGAFLFAALNILQPLAEACLERMQAFIDETDHAEPPPHAERFRDFRQTLADVSRHHNREYFVLKQIVLNNLYGVDIMEEAVEICKLRLFLKLVAQVETADQIEPLPDIDFNIRAGNTLVGFASLEEVERSLNRAAAGQVRMVDAATSAEFARMKEEAEKAAMAFARFHDLQETGDDASAQRAAKSDVRQRLAALRGELDVLLARVYGVEPVGASYAAWRASHEPFHWVSEFYDIVHERGGFDVIVGNPPYLEVGKLLGAYRPIGLESIGCRDIYAWVVERCMHMQRKSGRIGLIVPVSIGSSTSFQPLREAIANAAPTIWLANFANRPGQLFSGAQNRLSIILIGPTSSSPEFLSTRYNRWDGTRGRSALFETLGFTAIDIGKVSFHELWPKAGDPIAHSVLVKICNGPKLASFASNSGSSSVFWVRVPGYFCQFFQYPPMASPEAGGQERIRGEVNDISFSSVVTRNLVHACLNSSMYFQFFSSYTDGRHINPSDVNGFPLDLNALSTSTANDLVSLSDQLSDCMVSNMGKLRKSGLLIDSVDSKECKALIDRIDRVLAQHYGFTDEELDFIINYDYKYRMGVAGDDEAA